jgi:hypothetical protein
VIVAVLVMLVLGAVASSQIARPITAPTAEPRYNESLPKWDLTWGWIGPYNNNEVAIVSEVEDPPMLWLASRSGGSLGSLTFGRQRDDERLEAMVLFQGKQDERTKGMGNPFALTGEFTMHIRDGSRGGGDDAQFVKVIEARHNRVCIFDTCITPTSGVQTATLRQLVGK